MGDRCLRSRSPVRKHLAEPVERVVVRSGKLLAHRGREDLAMVGQDRQDFVKARQDGIVPACGDGVTCGTRGEAGPSAGHHLDQARQASWVIDPSQCPQRSLSDSLLSPGGPGCGVVQESRDVVGVSCGGWPQASQQLDCAKADLRCGVVQPRDESGKQICAHRTPLRQLSASPRESADPLVDIVMIGQQTKGESQERLCEQQRRPVLDTLNARLDRAGLAPQFNAGVTDGLQQRTDLAYGKVRV